MDGLYMLRGPMLALSTSFATGSLPAAVAAMADLDVRAIALHRAPSADEARALASFAGRVKIVALFAEVPARGVGEPLLVVDGGAAAEDREQSLEELCRRLHGLKYPRVALRTPVEPAGHPAPDEIALVRETLKHVGYWHDADRGGPEWLDRAGRSLVGASFYPLGDVDLVALRDALGAGAPAVVACAEGAGAEELREALRCARGVFRS